MRSVVWLALLLLALAVLLGCAARRELAGTPIRVASFNASLYDDAPGGLLRRLRAGDERARAIAAVIQRVRPDVLLLNEFDFEPTGESARIFLRDYLGVSQRGHAPIEYAHWHAPPVNTGVPSGLDLDHDGRTDGPADAWGFGRHPGQYGLLVLSRFPIDTGEIRSFRELRWSAMPGALRPAVHGRAWDDEAVWAQLRLSSKTHLDVPIEAPGGRFHFLVSHPTPPVFDGAEDRNGRRNHDEIRFWVDYLSGGERAAWIVDDAGRRGGLEAGAAFVIAGDLNADREAGSGRAEGIAALLDHPRVRAQPIPRSEGAAAAASERRAGDPAIATARFGGQAGNLRADYVLPSTDFDVRVARVFWPSASDPEHALIEASDHRLVWLDLVRTAGASR